MFPAASAPPLVPLPVLRAGDDPEFSRVVRIADPALELPGTFLPAARLPAAAWLAAWDCWRLEVFHDILAPALSAAARHAAAGEAREIRDLDAALVFPAPEASRSLAAGRRLYESLAGARGDRWLNKLQTWLADGSLPGHFAVAYACRYASFHLPGRLLLPTYLHWEWTAALHARPPARGAIPAFAADLPPPAESETALRASARQ